MRPIDADELISKFNKETNIVDCLTDDNTAREFRAFCAIADVIDDIPTLDVEPVVHAHWNRTSLASQLFCSSCGASFHIMAYAQRDYLYCSNCGAKMDEVEQ